MDTSEREERHVARRERTGRLAWMCVLVATTVCAAGLCAGTASADPDGARSESSSWLVPGGALADASGSLTTSLETELAYGGALLVSGRSGHDGSCTLDVSVGAETRSVELGPRHSVVHVELSGSDGPATWAVAADACRGAAVEGVVLFAGSAAAYVGDNPAKYFESLRGAGVR